jgi:hypothetical protein
LFCLSTAEAARLEDLSYSRLASALSCAALHKVTPPNSFVSEESLNAFSVILPGPDESRLSSRGCPAYIMGLLPKPVLFAFVHCSPVPRDVGASCFANTRPICNFNGLSAIWVSNVWEWPMVYNARECVVTGMAPSRKRILSRQAARRSNVSPYNDLHIAMVPGGTSNEVTQLNIESLWSGGPFADKVFPT